MAVVDVEELARKQGLKPNLQLFAEERAIKQIFNSIKESPNFPDNFKSRVNGTTCNKIKNMDLLEKLRKVENGKWQKLDRADDSNKAVPIQNALPHHLHAFYPKDARKL